MCLLGKLRKKAEGQPVLRLRGEPVCLIFLLFFSFHEIKKESGFLGEALKR
jgi:hypothetical protein